MSNKSSPKTIFSLDDNGHVQSLDFLKAFSIFTIVVMHMPQSYIEGINGLGMDGLIAIKIPSFKAFNDVFASFGYMAAALLLYSFFGNATKKLWKDFCKYSYEWYLVHMAVFSTMW